MKERGMIFNTEMVQAILEGRKTVTRRPVTHYHSGPVPTNFYLEELRLPDVFFADKETGEIRVHRCPYGVPGDRIYVRETWQRLRMFDEHQVETGKHELFYAADGVPDVIMLDEDGNQLENCSFRWRPSIHMPKWAARIWLEITDIRVEHLRDITEEQEEKEGINYLIEDEESSAGHGFNRAEYYSIGGCPMKYSPEKYGMIAYLESVGLFWDENPWVWVVEFKRVEK